MRPMWSLPIRWIIRWRCNGKEPTDEPTLTHAHTRIRSFWCQYRSQFLSLFSPASIFTMMAPNAWCAFSCHGKDHHVHDDFTWMVVRARSFQNPLTQLSFNNDPFSSRDRPPAAPLPPPFVHSFCICALFLSYPPVTVKAWGVGTLVCRRGFGKITMPPLLRYVVLLSEGTS